MNPIKQMCTDEPGKPHVLQGNIAFAVGCVSKCINVLGDSTGKSANVVMLGALSALEPFNSIPREIWLQTLKNVSPKPAIWNSNFAAFNAGAKLV